MPGTERPMMAVPFVDLKAQYDTIRPEIDAAIADVIRQTAFVGGPHVHEFEEAFARHCGVKHCVGVANGTDALFLALKALGIGRGDEVITAATSFIATAEAISMAGARPIFVDVDPVTLTIDPARIPERITPRTRAILPVHLYGHPAEMAPLVSVAHAHGLHVVGDAAQAHGACYRGAPIAEWADISCYSFYPGKNLGAYGDAGALVTDNAAWAAKARMLSDHGRISKYDHDCEGVNSRLDGIQAAVLNVKLRHLDTWTGRRRALARRYTAALQGLDLVTPAETSDALAVYHLYVVRVAADVRNELREGLLAAGIHTGVHYPVALPLLRPYRLQGCVLGEYPHAVRASREVLSLPLYPELSDEQFDHVVAAMAAARCLNEPVRAAVGR